MSRTWPRDALVAASWANIALLPYWTGLLQPEIASAYWLRPSAVACWAAVMVVLMAGALGVVTGLVLRQLKWKPARMAANLAQVGALLIVFDALRVVAKIGATQMVVWMGLSRPLLAVLAIALGIALVRWHHDLARAVRSVLLIFSPFLAITIGRAVFVVTTTDFAALDPVSLRAPAIAGSEGMRVVVVMFDELDYGLAFSRRPPDVQLDAFDRLRRESFFATDVRPVSIATEYAIPSMFTGGRVDSIVSRTPSSVFVRFKGDSVPKDMATLETLFDDAAAIGARSEVVGSYLPYCRWRLATLTTRCISNPMSRGGVLDGPVPFGQAVARQLIGLAGPLGIRTARISEIRNLTDAALRAATDSTTRLVFVHLLVPHSPNIWNAADSSFSRLRLGADGYFDNLALADHILARLRKAVDDVGMSKNTVFVVMSDHGYRFGPVRGVNPTRRAMLAVNFPSHVPLEWGTTVRRVPLRAMVLELLEGRIQTATDLGNWFRQRDTPPPLPHL